MDQPNAFKAQISADLFSFLELLSFFDKYEKLEGMVFKKTKGGHGTPWNLFSD